MFNFIYKEKIGILIVCSILFLIVILLIIFSPKENLQWQQNITLKDEKNIVIKKQKSLFYFDPNTLSEDSFYKLDISPKAIFMMINYRKKGGKFYTKEKVKSMWNLSPEEYQKIEPFIQITSIPKNIFSKKKYPIIDINTADSILWSKLPIPKFLIPKIIDYKNNLGGFYNIQQLKEINYFTNDIFDRIKNNIQCDSLFITKQNLNTISYENFSQHPYIGKKVAYKILDYRHKKVKIKNWDELKKLNFDITYIQLLKIYFYLP